MLSSHLSESSVDPESSFSVKIEKEQLVIHPTDANKLSGHVLFHLPDLPQYTTRLSAVKVGFSSGTAAVAGVAVRSHQHTLFTDPDLRETASFTCPIFSANDDLKSSADDLTLSVGVEFNDINGSITFMSAELEVIVSSEGPRLKSGQEI
ncbi:hypothetical protein PT974_07471 [Cladobotryum mycophilum]|uniref:Uncharacterized protein n=1 Tax=Cladobotryum mycophilum TaxID=491253 RepID=A0ABR0SPC6_9HYPO